MWIYFKCFLTKRKKQLISIKRLWFSSSFHYKPLMRFKCNWNVCLDERREKEKEFFYSRRQHSVLDKQGNSRFNHSGSRNFTVSQRSWIKRWLQRDSLHPPSNPRLLSATGSHHAQASHARNPGVCEGNTSYPPPRVKRHLCWLAFMGVWLVWGW